MFADQLSNDRWLPVHLILCPPILYLDVLTLEITGLAKALPKRSGEVCIRLRGADVDKSDHRDRLLLRGRRERPRHRATHKRDEPAPLH